MCATSNPARAKAAVLGLAAVAVAICFVRAVTKPLDGDFKLHREFASRFLERSDLYADGLEIPYPPFWAMAHAAVAPLPLPLAKALLFPLGFTAIAGLVWVMRNLCRRALPYPGRDREFWIAALALALAARYFIRDLAELGVNTLLVLLSWGAIALWSRGRDFAGGFSLGLAAALKCTPVLLIAFFAWKRQWRITAAATLAAAAFSLAPALWMGPEQFADHATRWAANAFSGLRSGDPTSGVLGKEPFQNMSLRASLGRYLMHLPEGHPGRPDHPAYLSFADLPPRAADLVTRAAGIAVLSALLWFSRARISRRDDPALLWQCAAASLAALLLSPITWGQHCVAAFPACYLIASATQGGSPLPLRPWMIAATAWFAFASLGLARDLVGRETGWLLESYRLQTIGIGGLFAVALAMAARCATPGAAPRAPGRIAGHP